MSDLSEDLQEIRGIGPAKAGEIIDVVNTHDLQKAGGIREDFLAGYEYFKAGHTGYADKFFKRVKAELDD